MNIIKTTRRVREKRFSLKFEDVQLVAKIVSLTVKKKPNSSR